MPSCEMCGNQATATAEVEGVKMNVCSACARFGKNVRAAAPPPVKGPKRPVFQRPEPEREELIETVHPDIARLLRQHREKLKLTQEQFAAKLGIRLSTYHHYESGAAVPDIPTARKIEGELRQPLVGKMRVASASLSRDEDARGLTLGDFIKRK